ncbi:MAG: NAD(P)/FAD-dependent oxidoreductase, partial [Desulfocucumaceae bacterium]
MHDTTNDAETYDVCVVGNGPAGLSAAVNSTVRRKKVLILSGGDGRSKVNLSPKVDNYLGYPGINGNDLYQKFRQHVEDFKIPVINKRVQTISPLEDIFLLQAGDEVYKSKSVIIATGVSVQKLLEGEEEFIGKGISYCATCDGPLFQGKTVTVIDYTGEGADEGLFMADFCKKVIYLGMTGAAPDLKKENIEVITGEKPVRIAGKDTVTALETTSRTIETDGIFIFRETYPPGELTPGLVLEEGAIRVNRKMETNLPGLYADGDCA